MDNEDKLPEDEHCCPEQLPSPQLPSPTDCFRDTNELLLDLALSDSRSPDETNRKVFDGLTGRRVEIVNHNDEKVVGVVTLVGADFLVLKEDEHTILVPFDKIDGIQPYGKYAELYPEPKASGMKPSGHRRLTYNFGEVVASSPELIQLFFGIRLDIYLRLLEDKQVKMTLEDAVVDGVITDANKESITIDINGKKNVIPIGTVSLIAMNV